LGRISKLLTAEELAELYRIDPALDSAFKLDGESEWEAVVKLEETSEKLDEMEKKTGTEERKAEKAKLESKSGLRKRQEKDDIQNDILPSTAHDATPHDSFSRWSDRERVVRAEPRHLSKRSRSSPTRQAQEMVAGVFVHVGSRSCPFSAPAPPAPIPTLQDH
jgi:hypothetical protein